MGIFNFNYNFGGGGGGGGVGAGEMPQDAAAVIALQEQQHEHAGAEDHSSISSNEKKNAETHVFQVPSDFAEVLLEFDAFTYNSILDEYMEVILTHMDDRPLEEWLQILKKFNDYHEGDGLIPVSQRDFLRKLESGPFDGMTESDWELLVKFESFLYYEWSVYPEVRAITVPIDEEDDEDYETFRVYVVGCLWSMAGCVLDTFFKPRYPSIIIGAGAVQVLIALTGQMWAKLPYIAIPFWKGKKFVINNGRPWSFREQMLASLAMLIALSSPYVQDTVLAFANHEFFGKSESLSKQADNFGFIFLLIISTTLMGFSVAGLQRAFFVYPTKMVFYDSLMYNNLNRSLVKPEVRESVNGWSLKRYEFFWLFSFIFFGWLWVTELAFTVLQEFGWILWIAPNNIHLQNICGINSGLAFFPINTFDTVQLGFTSLYTPWNALWQFYSGMLVSMIAIIIIWYTNVRNTGYLPINSNQLYDNMAQPYNTTRILNSNSMLDVDAYEKYSLPFYTAGNLVVIASTYMFFPAQFVASFLNQWRDFVDSSKAFTMLFKFRSTNKVLDQFDDRFSRVVRQHPEAPEWWFALIFCVSFGISVAVVEHWGFVNTPVYSIVVACAIALVFLLPQNALRARTTFFFEVGPLINLVNGMILEGNPYGLMVSAIYSNAFASQSDNYVDNQKIAHYSGMAPRPVFRIQIVSVILASLVEAGLLQWQASGALGSDFCSMQAETTTRFTCMSTRSSYNTAIMWGTISPKRIFHGLYPHLKWVFLIGALYPFPFFFARKLGARAKPGTIVYRFFHSDFMNVFDEQLWLNAGQQWTPNNFFNNWNSGNFFIGAFWQKWLRLHKPQWWAKYTYLFYNAITVANAFGALFIFFASQYKHQVPVVWWGNDYNNDRNGIDNQGGAGHLQLPSKGFFGPEPGTFPRNA